MLRCRIRVNLLSDFIFSLDIFRKKNMSSTTVQQRLAGLADDLHDAIVRNPTGSSVAGAAVSGGLIWAAIEGLQAIQKARQFRGAMCVVTGASTGIGAGCAMELARRGARVVILLARNEGALKQRCDEINRSIGAEVALPMRCDCGQAEEVAEVRIVVYSNSLPNKLHSRFCQAAIAWYPN